MNIKLFFISWCLAVAIGSCKESVADMQDAINITVPLNDQKDVLSLSEIVDSLFYIRLQTNAECLIGTIDKLMFWQDRLIMVDKTKAQTVFIFNRQGQFIFKINRLGRGPGEYVSLIDVTIGEDGAIYILDGVQRKLIKYAPDGVLDKEYKLNFNAEAITYLMADKVTFYCDFIHNKKYIKDSQYPNLLVYDLNTAKTLYAGLYFDQNIDRTETVGLVTNFSYSKNLSATLLMPLDHTIYQISPNDTITHLYYLNMGENSDNAQIAYKEKLINHSLHAVDANQEFLDANYAILLNYMVCNH